MGNPILDDLITILQPLFVGREFIVSDSGENSLTIKNAKGMMPLIDVEIDNEIAKVGSKYGLHKGEIAWSFFKEDLVLMLSLPMYPTIREAHWSENKNDNHSENDADSTYAVISPRGEMIRIFNTKQEAEDFIEKYKL